MRKELTKETELAEQEQSNTETKEEETSEKAELPAKQETLTAAEVLDIAEGNLVRALNAIRMLR